MTAARKLELVSDVSDTSHFKQKLGISWTPSAYQAAVWAEIENPSRDHSVVRAVAGSGKTTTITLGTRLIPANETVLYLAFQRDVVEEVKPRMPKRVDVRTIHSLGCLACGKLGRRRPEVNKYKYSDYADGIEIDAKNGSFLGGRLPQIVADRMAIAPRSFPGRALRQLSELARLDLVDPEISAQAFADEIFALASRQSVEWDQEYDGIVPAAVQAMLVRGASETFHIDYCDMIWLPVYLDAKVPQYDRVMVDEAQDLSRCQLALVKRAIKPGGHLLAVGDPQQAIYGFAGADTASFDRIVEFCGGEQSILPLSVCYRCPTGALDMARKFCPQIEAAPGAVVGSVGNLSIDDVESKVRPGDMMLCRQNAPLVTTCLNLIASGIAAKVKGRQIGDSICKVAREAAKLSGGFAKLGDGLSAWYARESDRLARRVKNEAALEEALSKEGDKVECVRVLWSRSGATTEDEFKAAVDAIFTDGAAAVILSSVHKAKGLEAENVFILEPELMESPRAKTDEQMEQERNLFYVALTRTKHSMYFVRKE